MTQENEQELRRAIRLAVSLITSTGAHRGEVKSLTREAIAILREEADKLESRTAPNDYF